MISDQTQKFEDDVIGLLMHEPVVTPDGHRGARRGRCLVRLDPNGAPNIALNLGVIVADVVSCHEYTYGIDRASGDITLVQ